MNKARDIVFDIPYVSGLPEMVEMWEAATAKERPDWRLPLLAATAVGGKDADIDEARVMAALGCMQTSIILIDDILDNESDGAQQRYGVGETANLSAAFQAVAIGLAQDVSSEMVDVLAAMALETAVGQRMDVAVAPDKEVDYWRLIRAKSGPFYGRSLELGAVLTGAYRPVRGMMYELGVVIGEMTQIRDDLMDAMAAAPANPDWTEGRANLLILYGRVASYEKKERFLGLVNDIGRTQYHEALLTEAQQILIEIGAVDYCLRALEEKKDEGIALLDRMALADDAKLRHLLDDLVSVLTLDS